MNHVEIMDEIGTFVSKKPSPEISLAKRFKTITRAFQNDLRSSVKNVNAAENLSHVRIKQAVGKVHWTDIYKKWARPFRSGRG